MPPCIAEQPIEMQLQYGVRDGITGGETEAEPQEQQAERQRQAEQNGSVANERDGGGVPDMGQA